MTAAESAWDVAIYLLSHAHVTVAILIGVPAVGWVLSRRVKA